jgi:FtsP/CotA-like multicopper oxidase with cupredoxin domain
MQQVVAHAVRMDLTRREFGLAAMSTGLVATLGACGGSATARPSSAQAFDPIAAPVAQTGRVRSFDLQARETPVDVGGPIARTWTYGGDVPGRALRVSAGDRVKVAFRNDLPMATSVHWHGLAIRNDMDGVPGVTTPETKPGGTFAFDFVVPDPGTHWFHPHHGLQMDRGLYAPFIVDDPSDPGDYDREWIVVLDDWTDGVGPSPERLLADLQASTGTGMMGMGGMGGMGRDGGDIAYPLYLINGRATTDPDTLVGHPKERVRLRIINAAADTIFTVALSGHELDVTHTDGYGVRPTATQALRVGMGERYDATVTLGDGVFPLVAAPLGKRGHAGALVRTGGGSVPPVSFRPRELDTAALTVADLSAAPGTALPGREPDTVQDLLLSGSMGGYEWTINGRTYDDTIPLTIQDGQAGRFRIRNHSMMSHPVHLHGHAFQLGAAGGSGPRKDTVLVPPMGGVDVDIAAENPGSWMVHCHNAYHAESGMMTRLDYVV